MLVAAALCPYPPLLVPELARAASGELDRLRADCDLAVSTLVGAGLYAVVVLGAGQPGATWPGDAAGSLAGHGVDVRAGGTGRPVLPLALTVGAWLLDRAGWTGPRTYVAVPTTAWSGADRSDLLAGRAQAPTGVLCMANGSAKRSTVAPGHLDPRAEAHDAALAGALGGGDTAALADLDADLASDLMVGGVGAWRALGAVAAARTGGAAPTAVLLHDSAPYGVGYLVATWTWP